MKTNVLYYGDNLDILKRYIKEESVDLIYLDPPFNSNQDYNILFAEKNGTKSTAQIKAFGDTWHWNIEAANAYEELVLSGGKVSEVMQAFRTFLGENDMMAYLTMMGTRLIELKRVLKSTGSIYLHCDPTASHYLKIVMDAIFGKQNFRNEIVWSYQRWTNAQLQFQSMHDILLFYSKTNKNTFNIQLEPYSEKSKHKAKRFSEVKNGKITSQEYTNDISRLKSMQDVWKISYLNSQAKERLGYPTQKPEALLERIIKASSNKGDLVLDPFCGCGTTISVAQKLNRNWIGIDITCLATALIKHRLFDSYGKEIHSTYTVIGEPTTFSEAMILAEEDPYQFQWWALGLLGARPVEQKKGADRGVDGKLYFFEEKAKTAKAKQIIFSVKAGKVNVSHVRDLRGVLSREKSELGVFISLNKPTRAMRKESASAGFYTSATLGNVRYPKIQLLTVEDILNGKEILCPPYIKRGGNITFKKAPKIEMDKSDKKIIQKKVEEQ